MKKKDYIDLLPREEKKPGGARDRIAVIMAALVVVVWVGAYGAQVLQAWELKKRLARVSETKEGLLKEFRALHQELGLSMPAGVSKEKAALISTLLGERVLWSEVFREFSRIVPRGLWFDSLEGSAVGRTEIRIKGGAQTYLPVAEFMLAIEKSGYFDKPELLYAQKVVVQGREMIGFEIICGIRKGGRQQ